MLSPYARAEELLFIAAPIIFAGMILLTRMGETWWGITIAVLFILLAIFSAYFFRNPKRTIHYDSNILLSPADGTVQEVEELPSYNEFINQPCIRISIFLSIFNVHINRYPASGLVSYQKYTPGKFINAMKPTSAHENEANEIGVDNVAHFRKYIVRQISGFIARRIVSTAQPHHAVAQGAAFGMIKFGSRTDLIIPKATNLSVQVKKGDRVQAGTSPLIKFT